MLQPLVKRVENSLQRFASPLKAKSSKSFFKTGKGEYGEGDSFLGVTVPEVRKVVKEFEKVEELEEIESILTSPFHEVRLTGALLYVSLYRTFLKDGKERERKKVVKSYVDNAHRFNNWDLVDTSASGILGEEMVLCMDESKREKIVKGLIESNNLWANRIAVVSMHALIKQSLPVLPLSVIGRSLFHTHDLMHKANGWMLREIGKYSGQKVLDTFLDKHAAQMPRTTLRYALEHYDAKKRKNYMGAKSAYEASKKRGS